MNAGVDFIVQSSKNFSKDNRLTVFTIGAATDVASAVLEDPSIVDRIQVVAMGFSSWPKGGDEFNVANDPRAWQVVLHVRCPSGDWRRRCVPGPPRSDIRPGKRAGQPAWAGG